MSKAAATIALSAGLAFVASVEAAPAQPLQDAPPAEARLQPYSGALPDCADAIVIAEIARRFSDRERDYWESGLALEALDAVRETGLRSRGLSFIPRRHCEGLARFNDGRSRKIVYTIGEGLGFIGLGWGVEWCVDGLDRNHADAPKCAGAGP